MSSLSEDLAAIKAIEDPALRMKAVRTLMVELEEFSRQQARPVLSKAVKAVIDADPAMTRTKIGAELGMSASSVSNLLQGIYKGGTA